MAGHHRRGLQRRAFITISACSYRCKGAAAGPRRLLPLVAPRRVEQRCKRDRVLPVPAGHYGASHRPGAQASWRHKPRAGPEPHIPSAPAPVCNHRFIVASLISKQTDQPAPAPPHLPKAPPPMRRTLLLFAACALLLAHGERCRCCCRWVPIATGRGGGARVLTRTQVTPCPGTPAAHHLLALLSRASQHRAVRGKSVPAAAGCRRSSFRLIGSSTPIQPIAQARTPRARPTSQTRTL